MKKKISVLILTALLIGVAIIPINSTSTTSHTVYTTSTQWPDPEK